TGRVERAVGVSWPSEAMHRRQDGGEVAQRLVVELRAAIGELAEHDARQCRMFGEVGREPINPLPELLLGGIRALDDGAHAGGEGGDAESDDVAVEADLAAEVIVNE